jgi:hypothetical protein
MSTFPEIAFTGIRRVTHAQSRDAELLYWSRRSIEERVIAGWELAEDSYNLSDQHVQEKPTGITLQRVRRARR